MLSSLDDFINGFGNSVNVQLPAVIKTVNSDGSVDVLVIRNDEDPDVVFPNVPVKHYETQRAYIFLGLKVGDKGLIRFCDKSIEGYKQNGIDTPDDRTHSLNDGVFEIGFYPASERYAFPADKTIEIGNKNGSFKLSVGEGGSLIIESSSTTIKSTGSTNIECSTAEIKASSVNIKSPIVNLGEGGQPIARLGDEVTVAGVKGLITKAGVNTSL